MELFGVRLHLPALGDLVLVPACGAGGLLLGSLIQQQVHGAMPPVYGMGAAGLVASFLALAGADMDAGWRGAAVTACATGAAFILTTAALACR